LAELGTVDVLFIPVGGFYTIDAKTATLVAQAINPRLIFPMHYRTAKVDYPITGVEAFTRGKKSVRITNSSEIEIYKESLPQETEIIVLESAN
jgi:L-ascorbate metabolism protein UlaG (beta-lactamase superfamily)